jgi:hypothetical protein
LLRRQSLSEDPQRLGKNKIVKKSFNANLILKGTKMIEILGILLVPILFLIVFGFLAFGKRLEHKRIMAAIEKGTPLSEIMPPKPTKPKPAGPVWIKYLSIGIALIIIGFGFIVGPGIGSGLEALIAFVILGAGVAMLICGLLHRKYYLKNQNSLENNSTKKKKSA